MKMLNKIAGMVIFSLIVMVLTSFTLSATPAPSNIGEATVTVTGHMPLYIDPIVPSNDGNIIPTYIIRDGNATQVYDENSDPENPARPFAIFGINGTQDAPVILTYQARFDKPFGMSCTGKWVQKVVSGSNITTSTNLTGGILALGSINTNLTGTSPSLNHLYDYSGGVSLYAYVYTITAAAPVETQGGAATGDNALIFEITAAYNF